MQEEKFDPNLIELLLVMFKKRIQENGEWEFQKWLNDLNFRVPEEFQNQEACRKVYLMSQPWLKAEVLQLEKETKLPWGVQDEDLSHLDEEVRKVQLVIRHRLTEIVNDLLYSS
ncbi:hypothetical protein [Sutcliffiella rhizosphaerae]|nr:hypothetical protein [Sutcliffiella rhizosphaerae]